MSMGLEVSASAHFGMSDEEYWRMRNIFDVQSITFTAEILPIFYEALGPGSHDLTLLDVGARTAAGTGLLAYTHQKFAFNRIKIEATALDINDRFVKYAREHYPYARYVVENIQNPAFDEQFDVVLASHTIEHVDDPDLFLRHLKRLAKRMVVIACPFNEVPPLIDGHLNRLDGEFFSRNKCDRLVVYNSSAWTQSEACVAIFRVN